MKLGITGNIIVHNITIRNITMDDVSELLKIRNDSFEDTWSRDEFRSILSNSSFFGFRSDHGFILYSKVVDSIDIVVFCVAPKHRHKGEGRYLLSELIKLADRNKCKIFLEVADTNQIAQNLYLSLEFNPISIRKNYYKVADGYKDAIVMVRSVHNNTTK